jgi:hypothetical protein
VPGSDDWVAFPIWILWVAPTFLILLVSKLKSRETKFISNWICFLSIAEIGSIIYTLYLAFNFGILPVTVMLATAAVVHYGINFFFLLVFTKQVKIDTALAHWCEYNQKITTTITLIGTLFNFKVYRFFFSRLFGRDEFNAPMESPIVFYSPFNLSSLLNLVFVKLVVLFACIFGVYYIRWGYQLMIECLELLGIELLIIALSIAEYLQMRGDLLKQKNYQTISKRHVEQANVMGFADLSDDGDDYRKIDAKDKERRAKPKALKAIHTMEKVLLNLDVTELKRTYGQHDFMDEDEIRGMEIMKRRRRNCASFRDLKARLPEAWAHESGDEQNFISEPNSPRSK